MDSNKDRCKKTRGQVFTPDFIVEAVLGYCGYNGSQILYKHIIDNSSGDGAFLTRIASAYIEEGKKAGLTESEIAQGLSEHIHGIEIDKDNCAACIRNLALTAERHGIHGVRWDVRNGNTLTDTSYYGKMDYVVGNPPYVRVHNLESSYDDVKAFRFADSGMTDLYLPFFEVGIRMLSENGHLCYITPSSWFSSVAARSMRSYLCENPIIESVTDMCHFQAFQGATVYTAITHLINGKKDTGITYYEYDGVSKKRKEISKLTMRDITIGGNFYLGTMEDLEKLRNIKEGDYGVSADIKVKNGYATLSDKVFIGVGVPDSPITISAVKASTGRWSPCLFPYGKDGKPLTEEEAFSYGSVKEYLTRHKQELLKGREEYEGWYLYGRSQAIADTYRDKLSLNTLIRDENDVKTTRVREGQGVYGGLYVISGMEGGLEEAERILHSKGFARYVRTLKKYKSGGYYTFSSKDAQQYISYALAAGI